MAPIRVAVAGASGIGKHHANWHHLIGSEVIAFLGTSPESCARTSEQLKAMFGFSARGYTDLDELLGLESHDIVDVYTPNEHHSEAVSAALAAGAHVLCEKPLVWDRALPGARLQEQARQLVEQARQADRHLGICTQYGAALPHYFEVIGPPDRPIRSYHAELETRARNRSRDADDIWIDMGSHPLSLLLAALPGGNIDADSLETRFHDREVIARFNWVSSQGRCRCHIVVRDCDDRPPTRRFGLNGQIVDISGRPNEQGVYRALLTRDGVESEADDYMYLLIRQFTEVVKGEAESPLVPGEIGELNLRLQLDIAGGR